MRKFRKRPWFRRAGRGSVLVISMLLMSSAILRLASGVALAEDAEIEAKPLPAAISHDSAKDLVVEKDLGSTPANRSGMAKLLKALQEREARLAKREQQIALRTKALSIADEEITQRLVDLEEAEAALRNTLSLADGAAENDLARLTAVYESMKPKDTAALFQAMEPDFAAGFLGRMRPDVAAAVMTGLPPEVAYSISVIMAGRNAKVPKS